MPALNQPGVNVNRVDPLYRVHKLVHSDIFIIDYKSIGNNDKSKNKFTISSQNILLKL
jgi:molybdenum cofactor biosynthesis enzyme MoaA